MSCEENKRLRAEYETAADLFLIARDRLLHEVGVLSQEQYEQMKRATDQARLASERTRLVVEDHTASHGCG
jgi:hypothetical protein